MKEIKTKENCVVVKSTDRTIHRGIHSTGQQMKTIVGYNYMDSEENSPSESSFFEAESVGDISRAVAQDGASVVDQARQSAVKGAKKLKVQNREHEVVEQIKDDVRSVEKAGNTATKTTSRAGKGIKTKTIVEEKAFAETGNAAVSTTGKVTTSGAAKAQAKARAVSQAAKTAAVKAGEVAKSAAKAVVEIVKSVVESIEALIAEIAAGGGAAVVVLIICAVVGVLGAVFAIFWDSSDDNARKSCDVIRELNMEYQDELDKYFSKEYDEREVSGSRAEWEEILAVYVVLSSEDENTDVSVVTTKNEKLLKKVFWDMNEINGELVEENVDSLGNEEEASRSIKTLYVEACHKTAFEIAEEYGFSGEQEDMLQTLLSDEYVDEWEKVIYGNRSSEERIVAVALSQIGDVCGGKYWNFCGFSNRIPWCACFVSWCMEECGLLSAQGIPKYINCVDWMNYFQRIGNWYPPSITPEPGMIIFYDWWEDGPIGADGKPTQVQDGIPEHVGIVVRVEGDKIYTAEGNVSDCCKWCVRDNDWDEIQGFGEMK